MPVKAFRPDFYSTDFQEGRGAKGENGKYEIQIDSQGEPTERYRVRIEADGYRTAFGTKSLAAGDPPLIEDLRLEPVAPLVGHVVAANDEPVNNFRVAIGSATTSPRFNFERPDTSFGQAFAVDGASTFKIAASFEPQRLRVFNDHGFAELVVQPAQNETGKVVLQPYAKVSGRLMQGTVPIGNEGIHFYPLVERGLTEARFQDSYFTQTDPDGYFDFGRLPTIAGSVSAYLGPWRESSLTSSQSVPLDLHPGDHKKLILGGSGIPVSGRVVAKGRSDDEFSKRWSLNWLVSRQEGVSLPPDATPLSIPSNSGPIDIAQLKHTDFSAWLATKQKHFVKLRDDGNFKIHGAPAGEYDLVIQLFEQPAGCLVEAVGTRVVPVTVTAKQVSVGELDLSEIAVECRSGPRLGSDMRAYKFANSDGQVVAVNDASGRYLLFHVWASWCAPCLASMAQLKADIVEMKDVPFTAIGVNVDADKDRGRALTASLELNWAQNCVGEHSDLTRQLAVSSVPAYYLIGPDGKLIGSSSDWQEMRKLLKENLRH
jgi:thiol-disulfide isomerase/thioredoxin